MTLTFPLFQRLPCLMGCRTRYEGLEGLHRSRFCVQAQVLGRIWFDMIWKCICYSRHMHLYRWSKQIAASKNNNVQRLMVSILSTSEQKFLDGGGHCAGCTQLVWDLCRSEGRRKCIIKCNCIKGLSQPRFPQVAESVICYLHWHHFAVCTLQAWKNQPAALDETLET